MTTPNQNIGLDPKRPFVEGDDLDVTFAVTIGPLDGPYSPMDLTGATLRWGAYPIARAGAPAASTPTITKTSTAGGVTVLGPGSAKVSMVPADTLGKAGLYYHELEVVDQTGKHRTPTTGMMLVTPQRLA